MPRNADRAFRAEASLRSQVPKPDSLETGLDMSGVRHSSVLPLPEAFRYKLERYARLRGRAPKSMDALLKSSRGFEPGVQLLCQGERAGQVFIVKQGWTFTSCSQPNGTRQIHNVQIPGDVAGLQNLLMPFTLCDLTAITRVEACEIGADCLAEAAATDPELAHFLLWLLACEIAVAGERLIGVGRRTAIERTAHFILELAARLKLAGLETENAFACPMTQHLFGDSLGLTSVHVNRMMRELRTAGLVHHQCGWLRVLDRERLARMAMFDSAYLDYPALAG